MNKLIWPAIIIGTCLSIYLMVISVIGLYHLYQRNEAVALKYRCQSKEKLVKENMFASFADWEKEACITVGINLP